MASAYEQERKGFWYEPAGTSTSEAIALETWARTAHDVLTEVAGVYHAVIRESELAERLQGDSGIHTTRSLDRWLTKLLVPLARALHLSGQPPLTALVVDGAGRVGERYAELLRATEQIPVIDALARERHAASERLECYRWAGSAPADGGEPAPVVVGSGRARAPRVSKPAGASRAAREPRVAVPPVPRRVAASDRPVTVCPTCYMAVPATGVCDNCG